MFELFAGVLNRLGKEPARPETVFVFELKLLKELGLQPDPEQRELDAGTKQVLRTLAEGDSPLIARLRLSETQIRSPEWLSGLSPGQGTEGKEPCAAPAGLGERAVPS